MGMCGANEGSRLKLLRVRAGIRPTQLARVLGIAPTLLSDWEDGRQPFSAQQRQRVLDAIEQLSLGGPGEARDHARV
jgi:transcriptional regulator with XRE-family HTH domain